MEQEIKKDVAEVESTTQEQQQTPQEPQQSNAENEIVFNKLKKYVDMRLDDLINRTKESIEKKQDEKPKEVETW